MKKIPNMKTDEEAIEFLEQDLSDLDFAQFKPASYEFQKKSARITMRLPEALLNSLKKQAKEKEMPYQRYIREILEQNLPQGN